MYSRFDGDQLPQHVQTDLALRVQLKAVIDKIDALHAQYNQRRLHDKRTQDGRAYTRLKAQYKALIKAMVYKAYCISELICTQDGRHFAYANNIYFPIQAATAATLIENANDPPRQTENTPVLIVDTMVRADYYCLTASTDWLLFEAYQQWLTLRQTPLFEVVDRVHIRRSEQQWQVCLRTHRCPLWTIEIDEETAVQLTEGVQGTAVLGGVLFEVAKTAVFQLPVVYQEALVAARYNLSGYHQVAQHKGVARQGRRRAHLEVNPFHVNRELTKHLEPLFRG